MQEPHCVCLTVGFHFISYLLGLPVNVDWEGWWLVGDATKTPLIRFSLYLLGLSETTTYKFLVSFQILTQQKQPVSFPFSRNHNLKFFNSYLNLFWFSNLLKIVIFLLLRYCSCRLSNGKFTPFGIRGCAWTIDEAWYIYLNTVVRNRMNQVRNHVLTNLLFIMNSFIFFILFNIFFQSDNLVLDFFLSSLHKSEALQK